MNPEKWSQMSEEERNEFIKKLDEQPTVASFDYDPLIDCALADGNKELFHALVEQKKELQVKEEEMRKLFGFNE